MSVIRNFFDLCQLGCEQTTDLYVTNKIDQNRIGNDGEH